MGLLVGGSLTSHGIKVVLGFPLQVVGFLLQPTRQENHIDSENTAKGGKYINTIILYTSQKPQTLLLAASTYMTRKEKTNSRAIPSLLFQKLSIDRSFHLTRLLHQLRPSTGSGFL
jgi:hypothetical protein